MLTPLKMFFFIQFLLYMYLVRAWESIDTCQMNFFETDKEAAWKINLQSTEFNTDKSGLYDLMVGFRYRQIDLDSGMDTTGITNVNTDIPAESPDTPQNGTLFGYSIETTSFIMHGMTFFEALKTGDYRFSIEGSDAAMFAVNTDMSPYCCTNMNDPDMTAILESGAKYIIDLPSDPAHSNGTLAVNMREGVKYLLAFAYINWSGDAHFRLTVTSPDGETTSDFTGYVGQVTNMECDNVHTTSRSYSEWSQDYSTTYSSTTITIDQTTTTTLETVYYVVTPIPEEPSVTEASSSSMISSSMTESDITLTILDTSSLSSESVPSSSSSDDVSTSTTASSFDEETSSLSGYPTSDESHYSSTVSSTQGVWSSEADSRSVTSDLPSSTSMNTDDAISRSHEKSTDLTSVESSRTVSQTSDPVLTTSETGSVSRSASSIDVTSSLVDTMFFGNSSSFTTSELTTSSKIDSNAMSSGAHTTDALNTNNDQVSETTKVTHPLNTPTSEYGESNDEPNEDGNYSPVNTKSLAESLSSIVPEVTQVHHSEGTTQDTGSSGNSPAVSVFAGESINLGSRLYIKAICILLPMLILI